MSFDVKFDASEVNEYVDRLQGSSVKIVEELHSVAQAMLEVYKQVVIGYSPFDIGDLRRSYQYDIETHADRIHGELYSPLIYAIPMEKGRLPGKYPPVEKLAMWALHKGLSEVTEDNVQSVAFLICRAIAEGRSRHQEMGGYKMFEKAYDEARPSVDKLAEDALVKIVTELKSP